MRKLLKKIVTLNRKYSNKLKSIFPSILDAPSPESIIKGRIDNDLDNNHPSAILEAGGIDRPLLKKSEEYSYTGIDIDSKDNCYAIYDEFIVQSIEESIGEEKYDMIISFALLEHVPNNDASIQVMFHALKAGGTTHHFLPSKNHPYSLILRLVGPIWQKRLIAALRPESAAVTGYPAFFDHCSVSAMRKLFIRKGFAEIEIQPVYRGTDYFAFFLPGFIVVALFMKLCAIFNWSVFASGLVISAQKSA